MSIHQLPDLARIRAFADRLRAVGDEEAADLIASEEGQWVFTEAAPYLDSETLMRMCRIITSTVPKGTIAKIIKGEGA